MTKTCHACGMEKPLGEFYAHAGRGRPDGLDTICKPCRKSRTAARRSALREVGFCQDCGGLSGGKRFCPSCNEKRNEAHRRDRALVLAARKKPCPACGVVFSKVRADAVFCSKGCRTRASRQRLKGIP